MAKCKRQAIFQILGYGLELIGWENAEQLKKKHDIYVNECYKKAVQKAYYDRYGIKAKDNNQKID